MRALPSGEGENLAAVERGAPSEAMVLFSSLFAEGNGDPRRKSSCRDEGSLPTLPFF